MRKVSVIIALVIAWSVIFTQKSTANEKEDTDTKINFDVKYIPVKESIAKYPNPQILDKNYTPIKSAGDESEESITFIANVSAYTAAADECGKSDGITASGKKVKENHTIACPREFKFGTKIKIDGYGTYVCEDRGGAIKINKLDIYMKTKYQAFQFGRRKLAVEVIN